MKQYKYSDLLLTEAISSATNWYEVCRKLNTTVNCKRHFKMRALRIGVDCTHLVHPKSTISTNKLKTVEERLTTNSTVLTGTVIKKYLIEMGIKTGACERCGIVKWKKQMLTMDLDHINGDHYDCRVENLQILCPNCHRIKTINERGIKLTKKQGQRLRPQKQRQRKYVEKLNLRKTKRPPKEELIKLVWEIPTQQLAKRFGVSDKAITKWCEWYGINKPPRGYWQKKKFLRQ